MLDLREDSRKQTHSFDPADGSSDAAGKTAVIMFFGSASTLATDRVVDPELVSPVKEHLPLLLIEEVKLPESMNCFVTRDLSGLYWPIGKGS